MTKRGFLRKVVEVSHMDRVRSSDICEGLKMQLLLLRKERSLLRWFRYLVRMPPGRLPWVVFHGNQLGGGNATNQGIRGETLSPHWHENAFGSQVRFNVSKEKEVLRLHVGLKKQCMSMPELFTSKTAVKSVHISVDAWSGFPSQIWLMCLGKSRSGLPRSNC